MTFSARPVEEDMLRLKVHGDSDLDLPIALYSHDGDGSSLRREG